MMKPKIDKFAKLGLSMIWALIIVSMVSTMIPTLNNPPMQALMFIVFMIFGIYETSKRKKVKE